MITGTIIGKQSCCVKFMVNGYEISLACDTSCNDDGILRRFSICIFENDSNVTSKFFGVDELFHVDSYKLIEVLNKIDITSK
jgi:hypothetical protein